MSTSVCVCALFVLLNELMNDCAAAQPEPTRLLPRNRATDCRWRTGRTPDANGALLQQLSLSLSLPSSTDAALSEHCLLL